MSRKHAHRRPRLVSVPMLISRGLHDTEIDTKELMLLEAFRGGWADTRHFDSITDMRNILTLAANAKGDKKALEVCDAMRIPIGNMRQRYDTTGRMGVTGDELQMLRVFIDFYRDFWLRQPTTLYLLACDELGRFNASCKAA